MAWFQNIEMLAPANNPAVQRAITSNPSSFSNHSGFFTLMILLVGLIFVVIILAGRRKR